MGRDLRGGEGRDHVELYGGSAFRAEGVPLRLECGVGCFRNRKKDSVARLDWHEDERAPGDETRE